MNQMPEIPLFFAPICLRSGVRYRHLQWHVLSNEESNWMSRHFKKRGLNVMAVSFLLDIYDGNEIALTVRKNPLASPHDIISMDRVLNRNYDVNIRFGQLLEDEAEQTRSRREKGVF